MTPPAPCTLSRRSRQFCGQGGQGSTWVRLCGGRPQKMGQRPPWLADQRGPSCCPTPEPRHPALAASTTSPLPPYRGEHIHHSLAGGGLGGGRLGQAAVALQVLQRGQVAVDLARGSERCREGEAEGGTRRVQGAPGVWVRSILCRSNPARGASALQGGRALPDKDRKQKDKTRDQKRYCRALSARPHMPTTCRTHL